MRVIDVTTSQNSIGTPSPNYSVLFNRIPNAEAYAQHESALIARLL